MSLRTMLAIAMVVTTAVLPLAGTRAAALAMLPAWNTRSALVVSSAICRSLTPWSWPLSSILCSVVLRAAAA